MIERGDSITIITRWLNFLRGEVELSNSLNLQNINVYAENFFRDFLNELYGYNLKNANNENQNAATIDLFDVGQRIAIQVTSDNSSQKIHYTINSFNERSLFNNFDRLIMLIITTKKDFVRTKFAKVGSTLFDKNYDVVDLADILKHIADLELGKLKEIREFIEREVALKSPIYKSHKESNQVETIMKMIEYLTANSDAENSSEKEPDPDKKIFKRFADYSDYLTGRYRELAPFYYEPLTIAAKAIGLDAVKVKKIQLYLKRESNQYLNEKEGNPQKALHSMALFFNDKLSEANFEFDELAAEFYLIDELIKCNVFPNP